MNRNAMTWIVLVVAVLAILISYMRRSSRFDTDIMFDGITYRVPHDYKTIAAYELTAVDTKGQRHVRQMTYGKDNRGNLFRIMWEPWTAAKDASPRMILEAYENNFTVDARIAPIVGGLIPIEGGTLLVTDKAKASVAPEVAWPWISGTSHKLMQYTAHLKNQQGNETFHRTMVWYCDTTQRIIFASMESNHQDNDIDSDWAFFVAMVHCHHD